MSGLGVEGEWGGWKSVGVEGGNGKSEEQKKFVTYQLVEPLPSSKFPAVQDLHDDAVFCVFMY